ncbi:MAG: peptidylprolyl isomerase [Microscillaceae bacterium]|nr:peptidylprolyl isomerase [Microscillaceae bacterium]
MIAYKQDWLLAEYLPIIWGWIFLSVIACQEKPASDIPKSILTEEAEAAPSKANETRNQAESLPLLTTQNAQEVLSQYAKTQVSNYVSLETRLGTMIIRLYEHTPLHRANFLQLVARGYYDGTVFHRVVKDMIIQGGNLDDPVIRKKKTPLVNILCRPNLSQRNTYIKKEPLPAHGTMKTILRCFPVHLNFILCREHLCRRQ